MVSSPRIAHNSFTNWPKAKHLEATLPVQQDFQNTQASFWSIAPAPEARTQPP